MKQPDAHHMPSCHCGRLVSVSAAGSVAAARRSRRARLSSSALRLNCRRLFHASASTRVESLPLKEVAPVARAVPSMPQRPQRHGQCSVLVVITQLSPRQAFQNHKKLKCFLLKMKACVFWGACFARPAAPRTRLQSRSVCPGQVVRSHQAVCRASRELSVHFCRLKWALADGSA